MPRTVVVLPTTSYRAGDFVAAATALGIDLVVVSEQPAPFEMGDRYLQIDCGDPEAAAEAIASLGDHLPLDGIVAADDAGVMIASISGTSLGLASNQPSAAAATRDKGVLRTMLAAAEVPQPRFGLITSDQEPLPAGDRVGFPMVVKPLSRSASQGVIRVDHPAELEETLATVRGILDEPEATLLMEEYVPGSEVAVEGILTEGALTVLAVFDKPDTRSGPSFPETIMVTPSRLPADTQAEVVRVTESALQGIGLDHGPVHVELKVHGRRVVVIEVAARSIGGLCSRTLSFGLMGTTLEALILRNALGWDKPELKRAPHASGVLMIPIPASGVLAGVSGIEEVRAMAGVTGLDLTITPGQQILAPPEGDRYLGFVYARAKGPDEVEQTLRRAMARITVDLHNPQAHVDP